MDCRSDDDRSNDGTRSSFHQGDRSGRKFPVLLSMTGTLSIRSLVGRPLSRYIDSTSHKMAVGDGLVPFAKLRSYQVMVSGNIRT